MSLTIDGFSLLATELYDKGPLPLFQYIYNNLSSLCLFIAYVLWCHFSKLQTSESSENVVLLVCFAHYSGYSMPFFFP